MGTQVTSQIQMERFKNWIITCVLQESNRYAEASLTNVFCQMQNSFQLIASDKKYESLHGKLYQLRLKTICRMLSPPVLEKEQLLHPSHRI